MCISKDVGIVSACTEPLFKQDYLSPLCPFLLCILCYCIKKNAGCPCAELDESA